MSTPSDARIAPLSQRRGDRWIIAALLLFACTSLFVDRLAALDVDVCAEQRMAGMLCWYGQTIDPLYLDNPQWLRVMSGISAWIFGPVYLLLAWAFWRGVDACRFVAIAWAVAMSYSLIVHIWMEFFGPLPSPMPATMLAVYLPYMLLPVIVIARMRHERPFQQR